MKTLIALVVSVVLTGYVVHRIWENVATDPLAPGAHAVVDPARWHPGKKIQSAVLRDLDQQDRRLSSGTPVEVLKSEPDSPPPEGRVLVVVKEGPFAEYEGTMSREDLRPVEH